MAHEINDEDDTLGRRAFTLAMLHQSHSLLFGQVLTFSSFG